MAMGYMGAGFTAENGFGSFGPSLYDNIQAAGGIQAYQDGQQRQQDLYDAQYEQQRALQLENDARQQKIQDAYWQDREASRGRYDGPDYNRLISDPDSAAYDWQPRQGGSPVRISVGGVGEDSAPDLRSSIRQPGYDRVLNQDKLAALQLNTKSAGHDYHADPPNPEDVVHTMDQYGLETYNPQTGYARKAKAVPDPSEKATNSLLLSEAQKRVKRGQPALQVAQDMNTSQSLANGRNRLLLPNKTQAPAAAPAAAKSSAPSEAQIQADMLHYKKTRDQIVAAYKARGLM
jgi:hypothetical protein